jgi:hypothetical protein
MSTGGAGTGGTSAGSAGVGATGNSPLERVVPYQLWTGPEATVTGILFAMASNEYAPTLDWMRNIVANQPPQPYWFGSDGSSPYALYFPSSGEGLNFLDDWTVPLANGRTTTYDAAMFTPQTNNPWGLSKDAHIVTLEVNDGRGSNSGVHFVATDVTVLDGTPEVPMDPVAVMREASADFEQDVASSEASIDAELAAARESAAPPASATLTESRAQGLWPTWRTQSNQLELTFVHRRDEIWRTPAETGAFPGMPNPAPSPIPQPPPGSRANHVYRCRVEYLITYLIEADGETSDVRTYGPQGIASPKTVEYF